MLTVSSGFKTSIKQPTVKSDGKVDIINANGTLSFDSGSISKIEVYGSAFQNDKVLGNLAQHSLTVEILGDLTKDISLNLENVVKPYIGVKVGSSFEYVQYQDFLITEITYSDTTNITKILATDSLVKLNKEYTDTNVYPLTLKAYLESVLTSCGLLLENTTFFNSDFVLTEQKIANLTLARDIVSKVAELALCFVSVNKVSNKIELKKAFDPFTRGYTHNELSAFTHDELSEYTHYELSHAITLEDESVDKQNYWNFKLNDHWFGKFGINTLTLKISQVEGESNTVQDSGYVSADGVVELSISDNPFINTELLRLSVINAMFDEVKNYKYYPYSLEYIGFPYLEVGDIVNITRMDNANFGSPIYDLTLRYDGGLLGKLNAKALSQTQTKFYNTQTLSQRTKNAEIIVDKLQGEVTIMAGDYYDGKLEGAKYVFDGDNATFFGGGLKIKNNALEDVFYADVDGNLTITGDFKSYKDGVLRVELDEDSLRFNTETGNTIGYLSAFNSTDTRAFTISDGTTGGAGVRFRMDTSPTTNQRTARIETQAGQNLSKMIFYSKEGSKPYAQISTSMFPSPNIVNNGLVSSDPDNSFIGNIQLNLTTFDQTSAFIRTFANGQIWLDSTIEYYSIYIGGAYRTIYRDANGFLKC